MKSSLKLVGSSSTSRGRELLAQATATLSHDPVRGRTTIVAALLAAVQAGDEQLEHDVFETWRRFSRGELPTELAEAA